ncbi:MAG TPA: SpoIIE family protein phosphatase [Methylophilaceae bacterium]|jgi:serine phosphatase RsbU (regulator of sigma subunit)/predicted transcriptional regulator
MITEINRSNAGLTEIESEYIAKNLLINVPVLSPVHTNEDVVTAFTMHENVIGLPVIENNRPIGLINRNIFMDGMAKPFYRDLFGRKSCIAFMDKSPLIVDESMSIEELSFKVAGSGRKTLNDGFIITNASGQYLGVGIGEDLVKVITNLQAEKNRLVMESINYASVIQNSFLRSSKQDLAASLSDYYLHWEPRDKVGGDYYFCKKFDDGFFLALIDCTGHGVPGAFMTLIMASFIDHVLVEDNRHDPASALSVMNRKVKAALGQIGEARFTSDADHKFNKMASKDGSDDGMDAVFIWVNTAKKKITYAGAKTPLFYINPDESEVHVLAPSKKGVGYIDTPMDFKWANTEIEITEGMCVYLTTDGIIDQIGGEKSIAFGKKRYSELLLKHHALPMAEQETELMNAYYQYQGKQKRRDDVSAIGFKL